MRKTLSVMLFVSLFLLAPLLTGFNTGQRPIGWSKSHRLSTLDKAEVKNPKGEILGEIEDFVIDPQSGRVALVIFSHVGTVGMGRKVKMIPYEFFSFDEKGQDFILDISREDLSSPMQVKNLQGKRLGEIGDFIIDSRGQIPFALLSRGEKSIFIPYGALALEHTGAFFVMDASEEMLASAPFADEGVDSIDQAKAEEIYRYFGQSPYWTAE